MADATEVQPAVSETAPAVAVATEAQAQDQQDTETTVTAAASENGMEIEIDDDVLSRKVTLADVTAKATALYARKEYGTAADLFSQAVSMSVEMSDGVDIHPDNGEIFFLYGRSMFKIGQSKSDVLGTKAAGEKKEETKEEEEKKPETKKTEAEKVTREGLAAVAEDTAGDAAAKKADPADPSKPLFHFEGDENFEDSDEDQDDEGEGEAAEDDEMEIANDTLEVARISLGKRLALLEEEENQANGKGKEVSGGDSAEIRHVKERLADTYDIIAEINLENEKFPEASQNFRESLKYKKELYPPESEVMAEAHYKLALALEFAALTTTAEEGADQTYDEALREEAISEMEEAIASTKLKLKAKEVELAEMANPEENVATKAQISDVRDMIEDMEQRLKEMKQPTIDFKATLEAAAGNAIQGLLGSALGETPAQTQARIEEAKKTATDLTGIVRKKAKKEEPQASNVAHTNGSESNGTKRKAEEPAESDDASKKAKVSEETA